MAGSRGVYKETERDHLLRADNSPPECQVSSVCLQRSQILCSSSRIPTVSCNFILPSPSTITNTQHHWISLDITHRPCRTVSTSQTKSGSSTYCLPSLIVVSVLTSLRSAKTVKAPRSKIPTSQKQHSQKKHKQPVMLELWRLELKFQNLPVTETLIMRQAREVRPLPLPSPTRLSLTSATDPHTD